MSESFRGKLDIFFVSFHVSVSVFVHVAVSRCLVGHNLNFHVETYLYRKSFLHGHQKEVYHSLLLKDE